MYSFNFPPSLYRSNFPSYGIVYYVVSVVSPDWNQSRSVDARQELDLRIGCAFTRFQTMYFQVPTCTAVTACNTIGVCSIRVNILI